MTDQVMSLAIKDIHIKGFKAIDDLKLSFPSPDMKGDPNIIVLGSRNGIGKTSIMEAVTLLYWSILEIIDDVDENTQRNQWKSTLVPSFLSEMPIREGADEVLLEANVEVSGVEGSIKVHFDEEDGFNFYTKLEVAIALKALKQQIGVVVHQPDGSLFGRENEPFLLPNFIYFHSYRKVQEGNIGMGMLVDNTATTRKRKNQDTPISIFKMEILRALMSQGGLFETKNVNETKKTLDILNGLVREFAGGTIDKLRPASDNTMEFRVTPIHGGPTFNFDGLSSGQKEIISTLFLTWCLSKDRPGIVLIDEPELHLNSEWHRKFVQYLTKLAPQNQYILATHSEDIFASVDPDRRILLEPDGGEQA
ncbi:MAG: AAA family ATPase [Tumebacillaceae bacterium]